MPSNINKTIVHQSFRAFGENMIVTVTKGGATRMEQTGVQASRTFSDKTHALSAPLRDTSSEVCAGKCVGNKVDTLSTVDGKPYCTNCWKQQAKEQSENIVRGLMRELAKNRSLTKAQSDSNAYYNAFEAHVVVARLKQVPWEEAIETAKQQCVGITGPTVLNEHRAAWIAFAESELRVAAVVAQRRKPVPAGTGGVKRKAEDAVQPMAPMAPKAPKAPRTCELRAEDLLLLDGLEASEVAQQKAHDAALVLAAIMSDDVVWVQGCVTEPGHKHFGAMYWSPPKFPEIPRTFQQGGYCLACRYPSSARSFRHVGNSKCLNTRRDQGDCLKCAYVSNQRFQHSRQDGCIMVDDTAFCGAVAYTA